MELFIEERVPHSSSITNPSSVPFVVRLDNSRVYTFTPAVPNGFEWLSTGTNTIDSVSIFTTNYTLVTTPTTDAGEVQWEFDSTTGEVTLTFGEAPNVTFGGRSYSIFVGYTIAVASDDDIPEQNIYPVSMCIMEKVDGPRGSIEIVNARFIPPWATATTDYIELGSPRLGFLDNYGRFVPTTTATQY